MKKVLALVLVAMMVIGMAPVTLAAVAGDGVVWTYGKSTTGQIAASASDYVIPFGENPTLDLDDTMNPANNEVFLTYSDGYTTRTLTSGAEYDALLATIIAVNNRTVYNNAVLNADNSITLTEYTYLSRKEVKDQKLEPKIRITNGQRVIDEVKWDYVKVDTTRNNDIALVKVVFVDKFVSINDVDYKFVVYLSKDKKRMDETEVTFEGNFENRVIEVDQDDVYVYIGDKDDAHVIESLAYIKDIEIELSNDIFVYTKLYNNKKYYAYGEGKVRSDDDAIVTKYPAIDYVYNIDSIGLNNSYTTVKLAEIGDTMYVYNANLEYIGTSNEKLPFSSKYYVSSVELDVDGADVTEPTSDYGDDFESDPGMGGDDVPENVNDNPGTGC